MTVDSYRFLPRSFRPLYEGRGPFPGEEAAVWTPFRRRLAESRVGLLTSSGMHLAAEPAFDLDGERAHPEWGDPSWRAIPDSTKPGDIAAAHLHIDTGDVTADPEIALPLRSLQELAADGVVGSSAPTHYSVMGYQDRALEGWRRDTAPAIVDRLRREEVDGLILAPA